MGPAPESVFRRAIDACPIAFLVSEAGRVAYANPAAAALVGVSDVGALAGSGVADWLDPDDRPALEAWMAAVRDATAPPARARVVERVRRPDGEVRFVETTTVRVPDAGATFLTAMQEVTDHRHAADRSRALEAMLHQQQRLADVGTITTRIVRDIANPVAGLIMGAQRALRVIDRLPSETAAMVRPAIDRLLATGRHLEGMLQEFKRCARLRRLEPKAMALEPLLAEVAEAWAAEAGRRRVALRVACPPDVVVHADRLQLRRVFDTLVKNALEALEGGPGSIDVEVVRKVARVRIRVADSGPGIPPGADPFALFETTKPNGTGVSLASVREIVGAHGGTIDSELRAGGGAVFHVTLPTTPPAA